MPALVAGIRVLSLESTPGAVSARPPRQWARDTNDTKSSSRDIRVKQQRRQLAGAETLRVCRMIEVTVGYQPAEGRHEHPLFPRAQRCEGRLAQFDLQGLVRGLRLRFRSRELSQHRLRNRRHRRRQTDFLAAHAHPRQQYRLGAAAGDGGNGCDAEWCDACRRERRGPTGLSPRPRQRVGHQRGAPRRDAPRSRPDADPRLRPDRARNVHPGRHRRRRAGGALRRRPAERGSGRERRCDPGGPGRGLFHAHRRAQRRLAERAAPGLVRDHGRRPRYGEARRRRLRVPERDRARRGRACRRDEDGRHRPQPHRIRSHQRRAHRGITRVGATPTKVYDLTLADVAVSDVAVTKAADSDTLDYSLSLDYGKIALVTNGIDGSGHPVKNGEFAYDVTNHTEIAPFSLGLQLGSASSSSSAATYFLALDGVRGDVALAFTGVAGAGLPHGWFEVNSFDIDMEGVGLAAKKADFSPLTLTLDSNTALAPLLTKAATDNPNTIKAAALVGVTGGHVSSRLDLGTLQVSKVEDVAGDGLTVSIDFADIKLWTFTQDRNGVVSHANDFTWNVSTNTDHVDIPSLRDAGIDATSPEPATYFMLIDGLNGGSTDPSHQGWFEITGFDLDLENLGGAGTGKPNFSLLNVTLPQEAGLADVMALVATGTLVKGVRIEGFTDGTTPAKVYELSLGNVLATKVVDGEDGGYNLSLDYGTIALVTTNEAGAQTREFTYDIVNNVTNVSPDPSSLALNPAGSGGAVTPAKYFLALDGVKGDSIDTNHKGWFEISGFDFDLGNTSSIGSAPGGAGAGKVTFSPLTLSLDSNTGLAPLLALAATGATLNGATLAGVNAAGQQVYHLDLANVSVTNVEHHADSNTGANPTLTLRYGQIELETFTPDGTGGLVPDGHFGGAVPSADPGGSVAASPEPVTYFMLIDGINGGSQDGQHNGWFEIKGVDLDLAHATIVGGGTGAADFSPVKVTLPHETRLADVMTLLATGELVKGVRIEGITGGATPAKVYDLTLADVAVTKVADGEGDGYSLSLDYGKIALVTNGINATGQPASNGEFGYDVVNKVQIDPFTLALNPGHDPVANAQSFGTDEDTAMAVTLSGSDADGDSLTFSIVSGPAHGTLSGSGANLTYTPAANYNGPDSFTYVANDGWTDSSATSFRSTALTPSHAPVANAQSIGTNEDTATAVTLSGSDVEGDGLTFRVVSGPAHGTLSGSGANLTYPPAANYNGPDSFTYVANDGALDSAAASVSLTVNAVNDAPAFTSPVIFAVAENGTTVGTVTAIDIESNPVSFAIAGGADQAFFAIESGGALRFIAAPDFETPQDASRDNVYDLVVSATDSLGAVSTQTLAIAVANIAEQGSTAFRIVLDGAQQVPAIISGATGLGTAIFDGATSSMSITIDVQGLDWGPLLGQSSATASLLDDVSGAEIHNAPRGQNGPG